MAKGDAVFIAAEGYALLIAVGDDAVFIAVEGYASSLEVRGGWFGVLFLLLKGDIESLG